MIRALIYFVVLGAAAFGLAWLADQPGSMVLTLGGYRVEVGLLAAGVALLTLIAVCIVIWGILRGLLRLPSVVGLLFSNRRRDKGYQALSRGMIAVGSGDRITAKKAAKDANKLLSDEPMTLLLQAQAAQLAGEHKDAQAIFAKMAQDKNMRLLGLRGLYLEAQRLGEDEAALHYVAKATKAAPSLPWATEAVFDFQCANGQWDAALATLQRNTDFKLVDKKQARRLRAVLLTAQAQEQEETNKTEARRLATEAHRLANELVPAAVIASRLAAHDGDVRKAGKIAETTWKLNPHPDLADVYMHARTGDKAAERLKRANLLASRKPDAIDGKLAIAEAAIEAKEWETAREQLAGVLQETPSVRACLLMAELEEGEHGDRGRVREWLARAVRAPKDPAWIADGQVSEGWKPVSPISHRLDAYQWDLPPAGPGETADLAIAAADFEAPALVAPMTETVADATIIDVVEETEPAPDTTTATSVDTQTADAIPAETATKIAPAATTEEEAPAAKAEEQAATGTAPAKTTDDRPEPPKPEDAAGKVPAATWTGGEDYHGLPGHEQEKGAVKSGKNVNYPLRAVPDDPGPDADDLDEDRKRIKRF